MNDASIIYDAVVVGGGPAGMAAAIALADAGANTALLARRAPYADNRTTALLGASVDLLDRLGVWAGCIDRAAPLKVMRLVQAVSRAVGSPRFSQFGRRVRRTGASGQSIVTGESRRVWLASRAHRSLRNVGADNASDQRGITRNRARRVH